MKTRSEQKMFELILDVAKSNERIRAVVMNGSRADKSSKKDCFQDYDICYVVTDVKSFVCDLDWVNVFGDRMIMQLPSDWHTHPYDYNSNEPFTFLMQFIDGTRIDLTLLTIDRLDDANEPTVALLDKDGILPVFPDPTGECYNIKAPNEKEFHDCCNEFWWLCPYVAKELWREGLPYAKSLLEQYIRPEFMKMLNWYVGLQHDYKISTGKAGKLIKQYLSNDEYSAFERTYTDLNAENIWNSLFIMCDMFRDKAQTVANHFKYEYPALDDKRVTEYLRHVKELPKEAKYIY